MRADALPLSITVQSQSTTRDSVGQPVDTWTDYRVLRAGAETRSQTEFFAADIEQAQRRTRFRVRAREASGVTEGMRVQFTDRHGIARTLDITSVIDLDHMADEAHLICVERL